MRQTGSKRPTLGLWSPQIVFPSSPNAPVPSHARSATTPTCQHNAMRAGPPNPHFPSTAAPAPSIWHDSATTAGVPAFAAALPATSVAVAPAGGAAGLCCQWPTQGLWGSCAHTLSSLRPGCAASCSILLACLTDASVARFGVGRTAKPLLHVHHTRARQK